MLSLDNRLSIKWRLKDKHKKKLFWLNKFFIKFTHHNTTIKSIKPSLKLHTSQLNISSNNSFLNSLSIKKLKSLWAQFYNKSLNILKKSISLKLSNKKNLNLDNSINISIKVKIKISLNSIKMIFFLFTVILLS